MNTENVDNTEDNMPKDIDLEHLKNINALMVKAFNATIEYMYVLNKRIEMLELNNKDGNND